jgi:hypothetical protein
VSRDDERPADDRERARAARFARLVDGAIAGDEAPPALAAEERALLETATEIHAVVHGRLPTGRRRAMLDEVFGEPVAAPAPAPARRPARRAFALCVAAAACAVAMLALFTRPVAAPGLTRNDRLIGPITPAEVDDARGRLDRIYADRLSAHRARLLGTVPQ